jgi:hypothetical protein
MEQPGTFSAESFFSVGIKKEEKERANSALYISCKLDFHYHFRICLFIVAIISHQRRKNVMKFPIFVRVPRDAKLVLLLCLLFHHAHEP